MSPDILIHVSDNHGRKKVGVNEKRMKEKTRKRNNEEMNK